MLKGSAEPHSVEVSALDSPGRVLMVNFKNFPKAFIARVKSTKAPPNSVPTGKPEEYFVAFSRLCTHMGAHLVGERHTSLKSIETEGVVRCPAHLTCFDLLHGGMVNIGQACSNLPQIKLLPGDNGNVQLVEWMTPPYGEVDP